MIHSNALVLDSHDTLEARLDRPRTWARDLALVGAVSVAPLALFSVPAVTVGALVLLSALGGALLGAVAPHLLHRRVRRKPWLVLAAAAIGLGGLWGGLAGFGAATLTGAPWMRVTELAATAGAAQLGWLWIPYTITLARRGSTWPAVLAACVLAPIVGWLAYVHVTW
jgi:hypothetical protein